MGQRAHMWSRSLKTGGRIGDSTGALCPYCSRAHGRHQIGPQECPECHTAVKKFYDGDKTSSWDVDYDFRIIEAPPAPARPLVYETREEELARRKKATLQRLDQEEADRKRWREEYKAEREREERQKRRKQ